MPMLFPTRYIPAESVTYLRTADIVICTGVQILIGSQCTTEASFNIELVISCFMRLTVTRRELTKRALHPVGSWPDSSDSGLDSWLGTLLDKDTDLPLSAESALLAEDSRLHHRFF
ncbi:hypothetical protein CEXT_664611 [Caerostris extrusa]|uniref:Uncharacterized protein n=1 Tax=Caerostris extrusa TaxID=172846 RepID=A0AAV4PUT9_CAEEX|nr:hypothetical protein CEXT_664611 [Caerostris extrusa]